MTADSQTPFGRMVAAERVRRGWLQSELADRAGVSAQQVGRIERGTSDPKLDTIYKIADALELSVSELVES